MPEPIAFTMANGTMARGFATAAPEIECVTVRHEMPGGSFAEEVVWRVVAQSEPAPAPQAPEAAAE